MIDVNGILRMLGETMSAFGVSTEIGRALLSMAEFFLTGISMGGQLISKLFGFFG